MEKGRDIERLIFFTDAVAAIAITLLILPIADAIPELSGKDGIPLSEFIREQAGPFWSFLLSFAIIARLWLANHELLENTIGATPILMWLDIAWAFTIVVLPIPTGIIGVARTSPLSVALYIGDMTLSSLFLSAMSVYLYRHRALESESRSTSITALYGMSTTTLAFVIAFVLGVFTPLHYWGLIVLTLTFLADAAIKPRLRRWEKTRRPDAAQG